jgi:hypothetical protein
VICDLIYRKGKQIVFVCLPSVLLPRFPCACMRVKDEKLFLFVSCILSFFCLFVSFHVFFFKLYLFT